MRHRFGARSEHRQREGRRVQDSATLADTFQRLKALTVELEHLDPDGQSRSSHVKYSVNLANAKSVFRFNCPNHECIRGDFDLSAELAKAVQARRKIVSGEIVCQGWRSRTTVGKTRCHNILRYKLALGY